MTTIVVTTDRDLFSGFGLYSYYSRQNIMMQRITTLTTLALSLVALSISNSPANAKIASSGSTNVNNVTPSLLEKHTGDSNRALYLGNGNEVARNVAGQFSNYFTGIGDPADPITEAIMSPPNAPYAEGYGHVAIMYNSSEVNSTQALIIDSNTVTGEVVMVLK
jgi:hypothetical protein